MTLLHNTKKINNVGLLYEHFLDCCSYLGIPDARRNLDKMLVLDYLIANTDRHLSNFGAVRNAETLEWLGLAPIYDSGASLWYNQLPANFNADKTESKPFLDTHDEQIQFINDFSWFDFTSLTDIDEEFNELLRSSSFIDETRRDALCFALRKRTEMLMDIITSHEKTISNHLS